MVLTIARRNEEIVSECCQCSNHRSMHHIDFLILIAEVSFQQLVNCEIRGVCRDAATGYDLSSFPKTEESFFTIEDRCCAEKAQTLPTRLQMSL